MDELLTYTPAPENDPAISQLSIIKSSNVIEPVVVMLKPAPLPDTLASLIVMSVICILSASTFIVMNRSVLSKSNIVNVLPAPTIFNAFPVASVDNI